MKNRHLFGVFELSNFSKIRNREDSYNYLEKFIEEETSNYREPIKTSYLLSVFQDEVKEFTNSELAFLLIHSGFIPEHYSPDSSEETFYSKLCEDLIREWAVRVGFTESYLPTMKSSTEDVTILNARHEVIVCDGKAFRLGRSQAAPNVKDMLKEGDIPKWLHSHSLDYITKGGMVVFPSPHDWKSATDFYQYTTNKDQPILALNYEHLSYILISGIDSDFIIQTLDNYHELFPQQLRKKDTLVKNRDQYYRCVEQHFFGTNIEDWEDFKAFSEEIIKEKCFDTANNLSNRIDGYTQSILNEISNIDDIEKLRKIAIESETKNRTEILTKQRANIEKFRKSSGRYYEDD
jgi:hypothetical protein